MPLDLADDLERIARHIPHVEAAAADLTASPFERAAAGVELAVWRMAKEIAEQDRSAAQVTDRRRTIPNDLEPTRTEANQ
ncbi:hypothetical protein ACGFNP_25560 [Nonomuraea sp. NPDC049269]|uniref:hypothetical protein n=1 Tax=Nonomuraea sp. NPDC049269 TaxID=3364349 RepID=UPI003721657B